ncbi:MAG: aldehyde dehydrogenase family protein [Pseudomonadales bacterium]|jgi:aldehyde dehydrogenase (NAD+)
MKSYSQFYINGAWVDSHSKTLTSVINPATEAEIATVPEGNAQDVHDAVMAARGAFESWSNTPSAERAAIIHRVSDLLEQRVDEIATVISSELGSPIAHAKEVQSEEPIVGMRMYADFCSMMDEDQKQGNSLIVKEAIGVCSFINPWNYPLLQIVGKVAPALAAGCTMVVKPSEVTPLNAFILAEIMDEAGVPAGVFNLVSGLGPVVGEAMCVHPEVDMVSFTGSTRAGVRIAELAAPSVKRVCQELGGKSPMIITEDLSAEEFAGAVEYAMGDVMFNSGQTCTALTRLLVPASRLAEANAVAKAYVDGLKVGEPTDEEAFLGPMSSAQQRNTVLNYIQLGIDEGAELLTGGVDRPAGFTKGFYVAPTVFSQVNNQMRIAREEIFGPVTCILPYENLAEAITVANDTPYGLSSAVWARSKEAGLAIARKLRAGQVYVNGGEYNFLAPFGGYKQSGNGREWGREAMHEFIEVKAIQL